MSKNLKNPASRAALIARASGEPPPAPTPETAPPVKQPAFYVRFRHSPHDSWWYLGGPPSPETGKRTTVAPHTGDPDAPHTGDPVAVLRGYTEDNPGDEFEAVEIGANKILASHTPPRHEPFRCEVIGETPAWVAHIRLTGGTPNWTGPSVLLTVKEYERLTGKKAP